MNTVCLIGRLTADPDYRAGEKHESATFRLAVPRPGNSDAADFVDIVTFDTLAGVCGEYLAKGRQVSVTGRLRLNEWTNAEGEKRSKLQVVADDVSFLDKPKADANGNGAPAKEEASDRPAAGRYRKAAAAR
jgi:single-strand DNA-binding protein